MNQILAEITEILVSDDLALVNLKCEGKKFSSLIIHQENTFISTGNKVYMVFKETEVVIGKNSGNNLSIKNCFNSVIKSIEKGRLLSEINLNFNGHSITSIITSESCDRLALSVGMEVEALVKTNDLMLIQHS